MVPLSDSKKCSNYFEFRKPNKKKIDYKRYISFTLLISSMRELIERDSVLRTYREVVDKFKDFCIRAGGTFSEVKVPTAAKVPWNIFLNCEFSEPVDISVNSDLLHNLEKELGITVYEEQANGEFSIYREGMKESETFKFPSDVLFEIETPKDTECSVEASYSSMSGIVNGVWAKPMYNSSMKVKYKTNRIVLELNPETKVVKESGTEVPGEGKYHKVKLYILR